MATAAGANPYLLRFSLTGSPESSVDRRQNRACSPTVAPDDINEQYKASLLKEPPFVMEKCHRQTVLKVAIEVCRFHRWLLLAAHVRLNHVHLVISAGVPPEKVMSDVKSYAPRALRPRVPGRRRFWTQHGGTRYLFGEKSLATAIDYVLYEQGAPMELLFLKERKRKRRAVSPCNCTTPSSPLPLLLDEVARHRPVVRRAKPHVC